METTTASYSVVINGEAHEVPSELTVHALLRYLGRDPEMPGIAVAVNDAVVRRAEWSGVVVNEDDRVEIITASQGG